MRVICLLCLWGGLWCGSGCQSTPPLLPILRFPEQLNQEQNVPRSLFPPDAEGDWLYGCTLAAFYLSQADTYLVYATDFYYPLVEPTPTSFILPLLTEPVIRRKIIARAVSKQIFTRHALSREQRLQGRRVWEYLRQADACVLSAGIILAEIRQHWPSWVSWFDQPDLSYYPQAGLMLLDLPDMADLEEKRQEIKMLIQACRQCLTKNPTLLLPPW